MISKRRTSLETEPKWTIKPLKKPNEQGCCFGSKNKKHHLPVTIFIGIWVIPYELQEKQVNMNRT